MNRKIRRPIAVCLMLSVPPAACSAPSAVAGETAAAGETAVVAEAAEANQPAEVRALLRQGADAGAAQVDGMTALHWAVYWGDVETARLLIEAGADAEAENRYGVAPLSIACTAGDGALVKLLLEAGADANTTQRGGETALMTAARTGKLPAVEALLAAGAEVDARERRDQTALMWAAAAGHVEVVTALLEAGADFRTPLDSGFTPFFFAVREGRSGVVQTLLKAGAEIDQPMEVDRRGRKGPKPRTSALILAVENGHFELAVDLLRAGADPNDARTGYTPLHTIVWVRKPNRGDGADGDPPPRGSGNLSSLQFVEKLVTEFGADVNRQLRRKSSRLVGLSGDGATPFLFAAKTGDLPLMRLLLELGADPLRPNENGTTPLMAAAGLGTRAPREEAGTEAEALEALELILDHGGDVNAVNDRGETAMHGAAYKSLPKVVAWLADHGAAVDVWNRKNDSGWTPLLIAQGYRPGNFKPAPATIAAIEDVMKAEGVEPPPPPKREAENENYQ